MIYILALVNTRKISLEKKPVSLIYRLKYRTGEYRWVLDKSIPRFLDDGTFLGYIGSLVDIHDYKSPKKKYASRRTDRKRLRCYHLYRCAVQCYYLEQKS